MSSPGKPGAVKVARRKRKDGNPIDVNIRVTDVLRKAKGKWLIVHEHVSVPVDLATGKADLASKP
jgi:ketosteroid isomerase-like protein